MVWLFVPFGVSCVEVLQNVALFCNAKLNAFHDEPLSFFEVFEFVHGCILKQKGFSVKLILVIRCVKRNEMREVLPHVMPASWLSYLTRTSLIYVAMCEAFSVYGYVVSFA